MNCQPVERLVRYSTDGERVMLIILKNVCISRILVTGLEDLTNLTNEIIPSYHHIIGKHI